MMFTAYKQLQLRLFDTFSPPASRILPMINRQIVLVLLGLLCLTNIICLALLTCLGLVPWTSAAPDANRYAIVGKPSITALRINHILCQASSPACGTGASLYRLGVRYGIDPIFALAFFNKESSFGKYGVAATTHSLGNIRCSDGYSCQEGFRSYKSWEEGYADWYQLIRQLYVNNWHLKTIPQIVKRYAPPSENDTEQYISDVEQFVSAWRMRRHG